MYLTDPGEPVRLDRVAEIRARIARGELDLTPEVLDVVARRILARIRRERERRMERGGDSCPSTREPS